MRWIAFVLLLGAGPSYAQSTYCQPYQNGVGCSQESSSDALIRQLLNNNVGDAFQQGQQQAQQNQLMQQQIEAQRLANQQNAAAAAAAANAGSAERRAAAYDRVASLISQGKCLDAKRLAAFYNNFALIADTAKACP